MCNNATKFREAFGITATEVWAMNGNEFLDWLNKEYKNPSWQVSLSDILLLVRDYIADVNLSEIANHIEHNNLKEWINRWKFDFERNIIELAKGHTNWKSD